MDIQEEKTLIDLLSEENRKLKQKLLESEINYARLKRRYVEQRDALKKITDRLQHTRYFYQDIIHDMQKGER